MTDGWNDMHDLRLGVFIYSVKKEIKNGVYSSADGSVDGNDGRAEVMRMEWKRNVGGGLLKYPSVPQERD